MNSGLRCVGRSWWHVDKSDLSFTFGAKRIYRMEPRRFVICGTRGVTVAMRGGYGLDCRSPARPLDAEENFVEGYDSPLEKIILENNFKVIIFGIWRQFYYIKQYGFSKAFSLPCRIWLYRWG